MAKKPSKIVKTKKSDHRTQVIIASIAVLSLGLLLLTFFWTLRPVGRLRFMHIVDSIVLPIKYHDIEVQKVDPNKKAQEIPVLLYHGILAGKDDGFSISKKTFEDQMVTLKKQGYNTISQQQYLDFLSGKIDLPEKSILITFDDGRKDSYFRGDAILKAVGFKATMFLASGYSIVKGSNYYVDQNEVIDMHNSGRWEIESHANYGGTNQISTDQNGTKKNFYGNLEWLADKNRVETIDEYRIRVKNEMTLVKDRINGLLGPDTVQVMSFPFGDYAQANSNPELTKVLLGEAKNLYSQVFVQFRKGEPYSSNYKEKNVFVSRRIEVDPKLNGNELTKLLSGSTAKPLPYQANFSKEEGWVSDWGVLGIEDNKAITISTESKSTSGEAYLDGTRQLTSYKVDAKVEEVEDLTVVKLIALYVDGKNYVGCNFASDEVKIEKLSSGNRTLAASSKYEYPTTRGKRSRLGIKIDQNLTVHCLADGNEIVSAKPEGDTFGGGPAILVWNPVAGVAHAHITDFKLEESK